jgi:hypothetical protein
MSDVAAVHRALIERVLEGEGTAPRTLRQAAFENAGLPVPLDALITKVALNASTVTDDDVARVRAAGFTEDQIFELVVCAAIGQATRQYESARAALAAALAGG